MSSDHILLINLDLMLARSFNSGNIAINSSGLYLAITPPVSYDTFEEMVPPVCKMEIVFNFGLGLYSNFTFLGSSDFLTNFIDLTFDLFIPILYPESNLRTNTLES